MLTITITITITIMGTGTGTGTGMRTTMGTTPPRLTPAAAWSPPPGGLLPRAPRTPRKRPIVWAGARRTRSRSEDAETRTYGTAFSPPGSARSI